MEVKALPSYHRLAWCDIFLFSFFFTALQVTLRNAYAQVFVTSGLQGNQEPCWCGEIQNLFLWRSSSFLHSKKSVAKSCKQYSYKRFLSTSVATFIPSIGLMQYFLCFHFFHSCVSHIRKCASPNCHDTWFVRQTRNVLMWPDPKPSFAAFVFFSLQWKNCRKIWQTISLQKGFFRHRESKKPSSLWRIGRGFCCWWQHLQLWISSYRPFMELDLGPWVA